MYSDRDAFFSENYPIIMRICHSVCRKVSYSFGTQEHNELMAYAIEGVIACIPRIDRNNPFWKTYLYIKTLSFTKSGAMEMLDIKRFRSRDKDTSSDISPIKQFLAKKIECNAQFQKHKDHFVADKLMNSQTDFRRLSRILKPSMEYDILTMLIAGASFSQIRKKNKISHYKLRVATDNIRKINELLHTANATKFRMKFPKLHRSLFDNETSREWHFKDNGLKITQESLDKLDENAAEYLSKLFSELDGK